MDLTLSASIVEFEVYLLMTMKPRLSLADTRGLLDAKLSKAAVTLDAAVRIHDRIAQVLSEETSRFRHLQILLGVQEEGVASLRYRSELWPGFEFNASAGLNGQIESAGYVHAQRAPLDFKSPTQLAPWSVDIREFDEHFGLPADAARDRYSTTFFPRMRNMSSCGRETATGRDSSGAFSYLHLPTGSET